MLEVKILKNTHSGTEEARKLREYIQNCHVYSSEWASRTEEECSEFERGWEEILGAHLSRSKFNRLIREGWANENDDFRLVLFDYLFRNQVPLWHAERLPEMESPPLQNEDYQLRYRETFALLAQARVDEYLANLFSLNEETITMLTKRDKIIAKNIDEAEMKIRRRYPRLADKDPLKYNVQIGARHQPEMYTSIPVHVVNLEKEKKGFDKALTQIFLEQRKGKTLEDIKNLMLITGLLSLANDYRIPSEAELFQMSYNELYNITKNLRKS